MKKLIPLLCLLPCLVRGQPAPTYEATTTQVSDGTAGAPFYISPRRLSGYGFIATNLPLTTLTNYVTTTVTNAIRTEAFFTPTNSFSGNAFALGTNKTYTGSSAINLSSIVGARDGFYSVGELSVIASGGSITITNPVSWNTNLTWTVSDGHRAECAMKVQLGLFTNFVVYVQ